MEPFGRPWAWVAVDGLNLGDMVGWWLAGMERARSDRLGLGPA